MIGPLRLVGIVSGTVVVAAIHANHGIVLLPPLPVGGGGGC